MIKRMTLLRYQGSKTDSGGTKSDILGMWVMHEQKLTAVITNGMEGYMSIWLSQGFTLPLQMKMAPIIDVIFYH